MGFFLGDQEIIPVVPRDPMFPQETAPAYVSPSGELSAFLEQHGHYPEQLSATIKLLDFGRGKQKHSIN